MNQDPKHFLSVLHSLLPTAIILSSVGSVRYTQFWVSPDFSAKRWAISMVSWCLWSWLNKMRHFSAGRGEIHEPSSAEGWRELLREQRLPSRGVPGCLLAPRLCLDVQLSITCNVTSLKWLPEVSKFCSMLLNSKPLSRPSALFPLEQWLLKLSSFFSKSYFLIQWQFIS